MPVWIHYLVVCIGFPALSPSYSFFISLSLSAPLRLLFNLSLFLSSFTSLIFSLSLSLSTTATAVFSWTFPIIVLNVTAPGCMHPEPSPSVSRAHSSYAHLLMNTGTKRFLSALFLWPGPTLAPCFGNPSYLIKGKQTLALSPAPR